jgi:hypothetical protein
MPKTEIDYSNTIIYKITCKDPNITDVYVGHTTNFVQRKHTHKQSCINSKSPNHNCKLYQVIRNNGGWGNWCMEIVNFYNCKDHYEARKKEHEYFDILHATLNSIEPMPKPKSKPEMNIINQKITKPVYYCEICKIKFQNIKLMEIHNETKKHIKKQQNTLNKGTMKQTETNLGQKISNIYSCDICHYSTCRKSQYDRHINTSKHIIVTNNVTSETTKVPKELFCVCGELFNNRTTLWRHKKKCVANNSDKESITMNIQELSFGSNSNPTELIIELLKQNQEFKELIIEQNKQILEMNKGISITTNTNNNTINNTNNTTNNKFNLNVFLNETCKDALNMSEFLESLTLCLNDFENFGPLGYCGGITNILLNGLNQLDVNKRPIHCSDLKREVIHVKNNDVWEKDEHKEQMIKAIKAIEHKNMKQMSLWAKANPEYKDANHKKSDLYTKLMDNSLGETDKEKAQKNYHKIIRSVAKEILVEK